MELLRRRIALGLSRDDLGRLAGISTKQVGLIERGIARHSREATMLGLAQALESTPTEIFDIARRVR